MFYNEKVLILGLARSGVAAARILIKRGNKVIVNDIKEEKDHDQKIIQELKKLGVKLILGCHPLDLLDNSFSYLIKNPGIKNNHQYVNVAKKLGIKVINEVELAYLLLPQDVTLIGITGTNGKTTTTTLTYEILHKAFPNRVHLAGNIGYPLCGILDKIKKGDFVVMEISVQQSVNIQAYHPHIALITNYSQAHLDFLGSYDNYKKTKAKMFYNQDSSDIAILNLDDKEVIDEMQGIKSCKRYFSINSETDCYMRDNTIYYHNEKVIDTSIIKIPGKHNLENILSAISIVKELDVDNKTIKDVISNFNGVMHRLEFVDEVNKVRFYNDTEATNIKCTQIALSSFEAPIIIILGGLDRGQNFDELRDFSQNIKAIIGIGETRYKVKEFGEKLQKPVFIHEYLKNSFTDIKKIMREKDVVLLSPASASWDQYKECEIRGNEFKDLVRKLKDECNKK